MSGSKYEHFWTHIGKDKIWEDNEVKLIGIINICTKANQKLNVLSRMRSILNFE